MTAHDTPRTDDKPTCRDCGEPFVPVQRGECSRCGSDGGLAPRTADQAGPSEAEAETGMDLRVTLRALQMANARAERWKRRTMSARAERDEAQASLAAARADERERIAVVLRTAIADDDWGTLAALVQDNPPVSDGQR